MQQTLSASISNLTEIRLRVKKEFEQILHFLIFAKFEMILRKSEQIQILIPKKHLIQYKILYSKHLNMNTIGTFLNNIKSLGNLFLYCKTVLMNLYLFNLLQTWQMADTSVGDTVQEIIEMFFVCLE